MAVIAERAFDEAREADVAHVLLVGFRGVLGAGLCQVIERDAALRAVMSEDPQELSSAIAVHQPDVLLMWCDALASAAELRRLVLAHQQTGVVVAVPHATRDRDDALLSAGARVVLPISVEADELRAALRLVARHLIGPPRAPSGSPTCGIGLLTAREAEVLELLTERRSALEIAQALHVSEATVNSHRRHIYEKLGVHSRRELAQCAALMSPEAPNQTERGESAYARFAYQRGRRARPGDRAIVIDTCRPLRAPRWLGRGG